MRKLHGAFAAVYIAGAIVALREGGDPIGEMHPVSLRPAFIILGTLLMIAAFVAMVATQSERIPRSGLQVSSLRERLMFSS